MNVIEKALQNLPGHWYQGGLGDGKGNYCGIGHVSNASFNQYRAVDYATSLMNEVALEQYPDRFEGDTSMVPFAVFNDHPDTTEADVIMVMEKAAIKMEEMV